MVWQQQVSQLQTKYKEYEEKKTSEVLELQSEVNDLMKHLEVQSAVGNAELGIKQVDLYLFIYLFICLFVYLFDCLFVFRIYWSKRPG